MMDDHIESKGLDVVAQDRQPDPAIVDIYRDRSPRDVALYAYASASAPAAPPAIAQVD